MGTVLARFTFGLTLACWFLSTKHLAAHTESTNLLTYAGGYKTSGSAYDVAVAGNYAYVVGVEGLQVINVIDPANCRLVGSYRTSGYANAIAVVGNYAYVVDSGYGLKVIDVSDPSHCVFVGNYKTDGVGNIAALGNYVYMAYPMLGSGWLLVIDVSNPTHPLQVGGCRAGQFTDVTVVQKYSYVAGGQQGLQIIDVSNPINCVPVASLKTKITGLNTGWMGVVKVAGNYAYAGESYGRSGNDIFGGFYIIDISNPSNCTIVGSYKYASGGVNDMVIMGNYAYVASQQWTGSSYYGSLHIFDVSSPSNSLLVGAYETGGEAKSVTVIGNHAYVADGTNGLQIVRIPSSGINSTPHAATATAQVENGSLVSIATTDFGYSYTSEPSVIIQGDGKGATAHAIVENGVITQIIIDNPGNGYTTASVTVTPPWASSTPSLKIDVSKVKVSMRVTPGYQYQLEASTNMNFWFQAGDNIITTQEMITQEYCNAANCGVSVGAER